MGSFHDPGRPNRHDLIHRDAIVPPVVGLSGPDGGMRHPGPIGVRPRYFTDEYVVG
jgi:hypothetical protein